MTWTIHQGDCIERMVEMEEASVVCDPPYGLSREPDVAEVLTHWLAGDDYEHRSGGFMLAPRHRPPNPTTEAALAVFTERSSA